MLLGDKRLLRVRIAVASVGTGDYRYVGLCYPTARSRARLAC